MSNLQLSLIALGVVLILLVLLFNWWQEQRIQNKMRGRFPEPEQDPLLSAEPIHTHTGSLREEPAFGLPDEDPAFETDVAVASIKQAHDEETVDEVCEGVIDLHFASAIPGARLLAHIQPYRQAGTKSIRYFAETADGYHRARLHPNESYISLQMAVVLANRQGPLNEIEWSQALVMADKLAHVLDASTESPDADSLLKRAQSLDELCANLDTQVGLTLKLQGTQPVAAIVSIIRRMSFVEYGNDFAWCNEDGIPRFLLLLGNEPGQGVRSAGIDHIGLLLDVPRSPADEHSFGRMLGVAKELAVALKAQLVDDSGRPVMDGAEVGIDRKLVELYEELDRQGIPAGSSRALLVFS
ncbi:MAG: cell division protein ZipA C-terminal FtsZ-binding domain-containing protein [Advenella sp.]|uniref:cell division protein ZipA C-terminal FtsZ-binding domain-containing protein n=1 Tax=Advenella sp. TaxID=1872388 RepID=UPI0025837821|nr:cell division protein ZipA C-terminal FtsZ-binding domain-containing protein [Advenella sp.]MDD3757205.1 cell division protein ZipA C-terminal FtsZ-binding domain-containing protein [Advenella sp.]